MYYNIFPFYFVV